MRRRQVKSWLAAGVLLQLLLVILLDANYSLSPSSHDDATACTAAGDSCCQATTFHVPDGQERPRVILHIGPHKTSTTTIQNQLLARKSTSLRRDKYSVPGATQFPGSPGRPNFPNGKNTANLAFRLQDGVKNSSEATPSECSDPVLDALKEFLSSSFAQGNNVILSSEEFDRPNVDIQLLHDTIAMSASPPPDVHVVIFYRNFYEWFQSFYFERYKGALRDLLHGLKIQPFPSYADWLSKIHNKTNEAIKMFAWANKERYEAAGFPNVHVLPMRSAKDGRSIDGAELFFCSQPVNASHTCAEIQSEPAAARDNQGRPLDSERLVYASIITGQIDYLHRLDILFDLEPKLGRLELELQLSGAPAPLDSVVAGRNLTTFHCPPEDVLQRLHILSVFFEERMGCGLPSASAVCEAGVERLEQHFVRQINSGAFCSLSVEPLVTDNKFVKFLRRTMLQPFEQEPPLKMK